MYHSKICGTKNNSLLFYRFLFDDNFEDYAKAHLLVFAYEVNEEPEKYNNKYTDLKENVKCVNEMDAIISKLIQNGLKNFYKFKRKRPITKCVVVSNPVVCKLIRIIKCKIFF